MSSAALPVATGPGACLTALPCEIPWSVSARAFDLLVLTDDYVTAGSTRHQQNSGKVRTSHIPSTNDRSCKAKREPLVLTPCQHRLILSALYIRRPGSPTASSSHNKACTGACDGTLRPMRSERFA